MFRLLQNNKYGIDKIRHLVWPIYGNEVKKVLPLILMFFLISFVYHMLRCVKITLIVKANGSGAEVIPFLKVWVVLPAAILFTSIYAKIASNQSRQQVTIKMLSLFIVFFVLFLYITYPLGNKLAPTSFTYYLSGILPNGLQSIVTVINNWQITLFYMFAEMWSIIVLTVMFWGFINETTPISEAKRFYAVIALGANIAGILSGQLIQHITLSNYQTWLPYGNDAWEQSIFLQVNIVILLSIVIMSIFSYLNNLNKSHNHVTLKSNKAKFDIKSSFKLLQKYNYIAYLAIIVVTYNIVSNLADIMWTHQLDIRFTDPQELNKYLGNLDSLVGLISIVVSLFIFSNLIQRYGWIAAAIIPPLIWLGSTLLLYSTLFYESKLYIMGLSSTLLYLPINEVIIIIGTLQMSLGKASKYTFFDQSKEIAFIPLSTLAQRKAKAIIDGIASRFGKSAGSIIFQILLLICGGQIASVMPITGIIIIVLSVLWMYSVIMLNNIITNKSKNRKIIPSKKINASPA